MDEGAPCPGGEHYRGVVRWEALFADLEGQLADAARTAWQDEVIDLTEAEMATAHLADRLRARLGRPVSVRLTDGSLVRGEVLDAAPHWLLVAEDTRRTLVPIHAVVAAAPLGEVAPEAPVTERRLRLNHVLRAIARQGTAVLVRTAHGEYRGWIVRVAADHIDLRVDDGDGLTSLVVAHVLAVQTL